MNKYSLDYSSLDDKLSEEKCYKYADVKSNLVKVAFDVVKFKDSEGIDGLWQIKATDEGEIIVAVYDDSEVKVAKVATASANPWSVFSDRSGSQVNVFYKNEPVTKFAATDFGIEDAQAVSSMLEEKLPESKTLRTAMLNQISNTEKTVLFSQFPELAGEI